MPADLSSKPFPDNFHHLSNSTSAYSFCSFSHLFKFLWGQNRVLGIELNTIELKGAKLTRPLNTRIYFVFFFHMISLGLILFLYQRHQGVDAQHDGKIEQTQKHDCLRRRPRLLKPPSEQIAEK